MGPLLAKACVFQRNDPSLQELSQLLEAGCTRIVFLGENARKRSDVYYDCVAWRQSNGLNKLDVTLMILQDETLDEAVGIVQGIEEDPCRILVW